MKSAVRLRRYVSAPSGTYPPPIPVGEHRKAVEQTPAWENEPSIDLSSLASPPLPDLDSAPVLPGASLGPLDSVQLPADPASALPRAPEELPASPGSLGSLAFPSGGGTALEPAGSGGHGHPGGILVGVGAGTVLGAAAALILLAISSSEFSVEALMHPVTLWQSIADPLVKASAILVAGGFVLLGAGIGGRRGARGLASGQE